MRTVHIVATASAIALVMVGCASDDSDQDGQAAAADTPDSAEQETVEADVDSVQEPAEQADEPTPESEEEQPELDVNERGNLVKEIGETGGVMADPGSDPYMEFTVTEIVTDGQCTAEFAEPAENGQFLFVELKISTSGASSWPEGTQGIGFDFTPHDFSIIGSDGLTEHELDTIATYGCLPDGELLPNQIGPGENVVGTIVLDTANSTGTLVYKPWYLDEGGWEWNY